MTSPSPREAHRRVDANIDVANPHRWDLDTPYLYSAASTVREGAPAVRPLRDAVRHTHHRVQQGQGLPAQRPAASLQRRLHAPRSGSAGRGRQSPRAGAAAGDHEVDGRERHPHQPQSARAGTARTDRPHGPAGDGRGLRHVGDPQSPQRAFQILEGMVRARSARIRAPRPQSSERRAVEHRQRDSRTGTPRWRPARAEAGQHRPQEDRTRPTTAGFNNDTGAIKNELAAAVDVPAFNYKPTQVRPDSQGSSQLDHLRFRDFVRASVRAASTTCRSRSTRSIRRCSSPATM